jgi:hypothetical protein
MIAGPRVFICEECVDVCNEIIADDNRFNSAPGECVLCGRSFEGACCRRGAICLSRLRWPSRSCAEFETAFMLRTDSDGTLAFSQNGQTDWDRVCSSAPGKWHHS